MAKGTMPSLSHTLIHEFSSVVSGRQAPGVSGRTRVGSPSLSKVDTVIALSGILPEKKNTNTYNNLTHRTSIMEDTEALSYYLLYYNRVTPYLPNDKLGTNKTLNVQLHWLCDLK